MKDQNPKFARLIKGLLSGRKVKIKMR